MTTYTLAIGNKLSGTVLFAPAATVALRRGCSNIHDVIDEGLQKKKEAISMKFVCTFANI
jgi:hypothetical protein